MLSRRRASRRKLIHRPGNPTKTAIADPLLESKRRSRFSKEEFLSIVHNRSMTFEHGADPVLITLWRQWFVNVAYYYGLGGSDLGEFMDEFDPLLLPVAQQFKANRMFRTVLQQVARLMSGETVYDVLPLGPDPQDQFTARVAGYMLRHFQELKQIDRLEIDEAMWLVCTGNVFPWRDWDQAAGRQLEVVTNPLTRQPIDVSQIDQEQLDFAREAKATSKRGEGDLDAQSLNGFQVIPPRGCRDIRKANWILFRHEVTLDWVWDHYPSKAKDVQVGDFETNIDGQYYRRLANLVQHHGHTIPSSGAEQSETLSMYELWKPPSAQHPKGLWGRTLRQTYLEHGPHPHAEAGVDLTEYPEMRYPISQQVYAPGPGRFWGLSLVEHLISLQDEYNRGRTQLDDQRDQLAHPKWIAPKGAELTTTSDEYGDFLEYNENVPPPQLQPAPNISPILVESLERTTEDMRYLSAQGEATQGDVPPGVRSGVAIRHLQERDTGPLMPCIRSMRCARQETAQRTIKLVSTYMDVPRMVRIYGDYRQSDVGYFSREDLKGRCRVDVPLHSVMPRSVAEQTEMVMGLLEGGVLDPMDPMHQEFILNSAQVGDTERFFYIRHQSARRAEHENFMFMYPQRDVFGSPAPFPKVSPYDEHDEHMRKHLELLHSDVFEKWTFLRKQAFLSHLQEHEAFVAQAMQAQAMLAGPGAMPAPGGPGGGRPTAPGRQAPPGQPSPPSKKQETPGSQKSLSA